MVFASRPDHASRWTAVESIAAKIRPGGARPPLDVVRSFIDAHREALGVEPICRVLQVAPSAYRRSAGEQREADRCCARATRDEALAAHIARVWQVNLQVDGADQVWRPFGRRGIVRGKVVRTTVLDATAPTRSRCPISRMF
jgi:putative transposase